MHDTLGPRRHRLLLQKTLQRFRHVCPILLWDNKFFLTKVTCQAVRHCNCNAQTHVAHRALEWTQSLGSKNPLQKIAGLPNSHCFDTIDLAIPQKRFGEILHGAAMSLPLIEPDVAISKDISATVGTLSFSGILLTCCLLSCEAAIQSVPKCQPTSCQETMMLFTTSRLKIK